MKQELHTDKEGRLFYGNWPEKPMAFYISSQSDIDNLNEELSDYESALSKAFETAVPVEVPDNVMFTINGSQPLKANTFYPVPEGYEVKAEQTEVPCPDGIEGCEVLHLRPTAFLVPLSSVSSEKKGIPKDWLDQDIDPSKIKQPHDRSILKAKQLAANDLKWLDRTSSPKEIKELKDEGLGTVREDVEDIINFAIWYSGMSREKVETAYQRYQRETRK